MTEDNQTTAPLPFWTMLPCAPNLDTMNTLECKEDGTGVTFYL